MGLMWDGGLRPVSRPNSRRLGYWLARPNRAICACSVWRSEGRIDAQGVWGRSVKVPLKGATVGLLLGIFLTIFLGVETAAGTALLIIICTLTGMIIWWIVEALLRSSRRT